MENYSVCQLQKDMRFEGFLLVRSAEKRKDVKGNDYVDMNVTDRTGEINCKLWNWDSSAEMPEAGSTVKLAWLSEFTTFANLARENYGSGGGAPF